MAEVGLVGGWAERIRVLWTRDPKGMSIDLLRVGMGVVWALNLIFILTPSNQYFPMFQSMASGYDQTTFGGPGFADFVASYPVFFAWAIAIVTGYLAIAFLAGFTTRLACVLGALASIAFLLTQFYTTFALDGSGTDVGAHPLYLLVYAIMFTGGAGQYFAIDHWVWTSGNARVPRISRWIAAPRDLPCNANCPAAGMHESPRAAAPEPARPVPTVSSAPRSKGHWVLPMVSVVAALGLASAGILAMHAPTAAPGATDIFVQDIQMTIDYAGNASQGGFGPSVQDGCWACATHLSPGTTLIAMEMLTDNHSSLPITVTSMAVASPFVLSSGPHFPKTVPAGAMWMFDIYLQVPTTPGQYTVDLAFTTA
ncbi:MAG: hypothetical protein L3K09_00470 [Thermoplasmata archaeon]|nr:hypothetical protein [Thermoplasmata archaeon]